MTAQNDLDTAVLELLPKQGAWSEAAYLWLTDTARRYVEYRDGYLDLLPWPTDEHQGILGSLAMIFDEQFAPRGGKVLFGPLRLRLRPGLFREPDLLLLRDARDPRRENRYWHGADLVAEVMSEEAPAHDLVTKRAEYAAAGISEYWIVNPLDRTITILTLRDGTYIEHGTLGPGTTATSVLLPTVALSVSDLFDVS